MEVDITGLDKAAVLASLWNNARPSGGSAAQLWYSPRPMNVDEAQDAIDEQLSREYSHGYILFDYLRGKALKVDLTEDSFDARLYDRDHGEGMAQRAVDQVRSGYNTNPWPRNSQRRNPWSAGDVKRHNKKCASRAACRRKWPSIANAVLRDSGDEGKAIRIANWQVKRMGLNRRHRNPLRRFRRNSLRRRRNPSFQHRGWRRRNSWWRNPNHLELPCDFCHAEEAEDGCHQCEVRWCAGCRYDHKCPYENQKRHNPWRNPTEKDDMHLVQNTLDNMTPCDKADWGFARFYYRNPHRKRFYRRYYR